MGLQNSATPSSFVDSHSEVHNTKEELFSETENTVTSPTYPSTLSLETAAGPSSIL